MSRIDEIKERTKNEEYIKRDIDYYDAQDDVQYLLSRLEIAEKALEKLSIQMPGSRDNELVLHRERIASEALNQIRE